MNKQERKIPFLMDNCTTHETREENLKSVSSCQFPPNITPNCSRMDQGLIKSLKRSYSVRILRHILLNIDKQKQPPIEIKLATRC